MKKLLFTICFILLLTGGAGAATYYVAQTSAGDDDGTSYANRASVAYHNAGTGVFAALDDDTVYLCDTITSEVIPPDSGTSGHVVTYRGDLADHAGIIDRGSYDYYAVTVNGKSYITFDGLTIQHCKYGIRMRNTVSYIVIKNCEITDYCKAAVSSYEDSNVSHITIGGETGAFSGLYSNYIHTDVDEDDCGSDMQSINMYPNSHNWLISYNDVYWSGGATETKGAAIESDGYDAGPNIYNIIVERNRVRGWKKADGDDGIGIIFKAAHDVTIRFNEIDGARRAIVAQNNSYNFWIYGNYVHDFTYYGIATREDKVGFNGGYNINIWANIIEDSTYNKGGIFIGDDLTASTTPVVIYNNTVFETSASDAYGGIRDSAPSGQYVKVGNNIFYDNGSTNQEGYFYQTANRTVQDNNWYDPDGAAIIDFGSNTDVTPAWLDTNSAAWTSNDSEDPDMVDEANSAFQLKATSGMIDNGADLSAWNTHAHSNYALNPDSDTADWVNTVSLLLQGDYGAAWDQGAYIYQLEQEAPPTMKAQWKMDTDALTTDSTGLGNTLTNLTATNATGKIDGGADFEAGDPDYMTIADASLVTGFPLKSGETNRSFTATFWYKPETWPADGDYMYLFNKYDPTNDNRSFMIAVDYDTLDTPNYEHIQVNIGYNGGADFEVFEHLGQWTNLTGWHHIALAYDHGTTTIKIRIYDATATAILQSDGSDNFTDSAALAGQTIDINVAGVFIGVKDDNGAKSFYADGIFDDIRYFNYALSDAQIDGIRNEGLGTDPTFSSCSAPAATYNAIGGTVDITVNTSEEAFVEGGTPWGTVETGRNDAIAYYIGKTSSTQTYRFTLGPRMSTDDLMWKDASITLPSGCTMKTAGGSSFDLVIPNSKAITNTTVIRTTQHRGPSRMGMNLN